MNNINLFRSFLFFSLLLLTGVTSFGQVIFTNPITGTDPGLSMPPYTTGQTVAANLTVSGIGRGSGVSGSVANNRYNASGWSTGSLDPNDYFEFILTPTMSSEIDFVSFVYTGQRSGSGPNNFAFRSSVDAFASDIGSATTTGTTISLSAAAYQNIMGPITFRFYGWGAGAAAGTFSINDFTFNGVCGIPTTQASVLNIAQGAVAGTLDVSFTRGNGANVIVLAREGSAVSTDPSNGTSYNANTVFGSGDAVGSAFVVYNGTGNSFTVTGLTVGNTYHFAVYEFNSCGPNYKTPALTASALPITLTSFKAEVRKTSTLLSFSTATETNNSHFAIERSADGRVFSEIGQVRGAGTTQEPQSYTYTDERPLAGINYYRLRQVDYDGTESFSPVVRVVFGKQDRITLAPSPATDRVRIHLDEALRTDGLWQVYDNTGRQVLSGAWEAETADYELDVNTLPEGMYTFRLVVGASVQVKQFRKM